MKKRWFWYIVIGILFGVLDFFFQELTQGKISSYLMLDALAFGIWLVPFLPIVLYEAKVSKSKLRSTLAGILTWCISVISYYLFMFIKLVFIGQASRQELYIANCKDQYYWRNIRSLFLDSVLRSIIEWIGIAIIGGGIIGLLVSFTYLRLRKTRNL